MCERSAAGVTLAAATAGLGLEVSISPSCAVKKQHNSSEMFYDDIIGDSVQSVHRKSAIAVRIRNGARCTANASECCFHSRMQPLLRQQLCIQRVTLHSRVVKLCKITVNLVQSMQHSPCQQP
jgi:hypothetical protein